VADQLKGSGDRAVNATDRFIAALNGKDIDGVEACLDPDFEMVVPQRPGRGFKGREQELKNMRFLFETFPDLHVQLLRQARSGSEIWTETAIKASGLDMAVVAIWSIDEDTDMLLGGRFYSESVQNDAPGIDEFMLSIGRGAESNGSSGGIDPSVFAGISNTYNRYVQSLDAGEYDDVVACFIDDGVLHIAGRPERRGKGELRAQYDGRPPGYSRIKHIVGGIWVRQARSDTADIVAALILVSLEDGEIVGTGNSNDTLRRGADGVWRFAEKRVALSWRRPD
jgi:hypothetical protein